MQGQVATCPYETIYKTSYVTKKPLLLKAKVFLRFLKYKAFTTLYTFLNIPNKGTQPQFRCFLVQFFQKVE